MVALALVGAVSGCSSTTVEPSALRRDPADQWRHHFERAQRFEEGEFVKEAEAQYLAAIQVARAFPPGDSRTLRGDLALAELYRNLGRADAAERAYRVLLEDARAGMGPATEPAANALNELGVLAYERGRLPEAREALEEALAIRIAVHGELHPASAATLQNLAAVLRDQGFYREAVTLYAGALRFYQQADASHLAAASIAQNQLALLYRKLGNGSRAEGLHLDAIRISSQANGPGNPNLARFSHDLANLYTAQERFDEAEVLFREAVSIQRENDGATSDSVRETLRDYVAMLVAAGREADARALLGAPNPAP